MKKKKKRTELVKHPRVVTSTHRFVVHVCNILDDDLSGSTGAGKETFVRFK